MPKDFQWDKAKEYIFAVPGASDVSRALITGCVKEEFVEIERKIYQTVLSVRRRSGEQDYITIRLHQKFLSKCDNLTSLVGMRVKLIGEIHTTRVNNEKLLVYVLVKNIKFYTQDYQSTSDVNMVYLKGYICKRDDFRTTPVSKRVKVDLMIAVDMPDKPSAYVPVVTWSGTARLCTRLSKGTPVEVIGRLQSRRYVDQKNEIHKVCEVSAFQLKPGHNN